MADKAVDRNQTLRHRVNGQKKALQSNGPKQGRTCGCDETRCGGCLSVQGKVDFGYGPDLPLSPGNHNALGTSRSERQAFCQRPGNHEEGRARVNQELDFRLLSCGSRQESFYVKKSHIKPRSASF